MPEFTDEQKKYIKGVANDIALVYANTLLKHLQKIFSFIASDTFAKDSENNVAIMGSLKSMYEITAEIIEKNPLHKIEFNVKEDENDTHRQNNGGNK